MRTLDAFLEAPAVRGLFNRLAGPATPTEVRSVALAEDAGTLEQAPRGAFVILSHVASAEAVGYRLDVAVRSAGAHHAAAVVLTDGRDELPATAVNIAERTGVTILSAAPDADIARLLIAAERELGGGPEAAIGTIERTIAALEQGEATDCTPEELLAAASEASGVPLELRPPQEGDVAAALRVDNEPDGSVCAPAGAGQDAVARRAVAHLAASAIGRARTARRQADDAPIRSRGELLAEFLLAPSGAGDRLLTRMRAADLAIDGWHAAVQVEVDNLAELTDGDELRSSRLSERVGRLGLDAAHTAGGVWHRAQLASSLLLVRMSRTDPGGRSGRDMALASQQIVQRITSRMPEVRVFCGVGTVHIGTTGLRTTTAEARAAVAAGRAADRVNVATSFDEVGIQRTLLEWYASDSAREAVDALLKPLDRLGERKRDAAIETLRIYLDNQGSLIRTAEAMHLHRNAVAYRIKRIFDELDVDSGDPDTRLMLQLACRSRSLG